MKRFYCKTRILSGEGAVSALKELGIRRLLLVTDPFFMKNGMAQKLIGVAGAEEAEIFDGVQPDPPIETVAKGTAAMKAFCPDTVVALGGGSAIDCAKAMICFAETKVQFVAIPTTSGSGSDVTDFAIITHGNVKHPLVDEKLKPDVAILDSDLLGQLPPALIADTGFDVLSHGAEAFVALHASPVTDALAQASFSAVLKLLADSYGGNASVRGQIHTAATMAGMAFSDAGLGLCHAMAHVLGGFYHLPHGRLNAILLPAVIRCNARVAGAKYAKLANAAGVGGTAEVTAVRNLTRQLVHLRKKLHLPDTLAQAGIAPSRVRQEGEKLVQAVLEDPCCKTNPLPVTAAVVREVLEAVTGG